MQKIFCIGALASLLTVPCVLGEGPVVGKSLSWEIRSTATEYAEVAGEKADGSGGKSMEVALQGDKQGKLIAVVLECTALAPARFSVAPRALSVVGPGGPVRVLGTSCETTVGRTFNVKTGGKAVDFGNIAKGDKVAFAVVCQQADLRAGTIPKDGLKLGIVGFLGTPVTVAFRPVAASAVAGKAPGKTFTKDQVARRLRELKDLLDKGLITQSFYDRKVEECKTTE